MQIHCPTVNSILFGHVTTEELATVVPVVNPKSSAITLSGTVVPAGIIGTPKAMDAAPAEKFVTATVAKATVEPMDAICAAAINVVLNACGTVSMAMNDGLSMMPAPPTFGELTAAYPPCG